VKVGKQLEKIDRRSYEWVFSGFLSRRLRVMRDFIARVFRVAQPAWQGRRNRMKTGATGPNI
jgi:hypothetical protein